MAGAIGTVSTVTQIADGNQAWNGLNNLQANDNQYATCQRAGTGLFPNQNGQFQPNSLQVNFNIPAVPLESDFLGATVSVGRFHSNLFSSANDGVVRLTVDGVPVGQNKATAATWPLTEQTILYGGQTDQWGAGAQLDAVFNAGQPNRVGLRFQPTDCTNETLSVDFFVINLFYRWSDIYLQVGGQWVKSYPEIQQAGVMRPPLSASVFRNGQWQLVYIG